MDKSEATPAKTKSKAAAKSAVKTKLASSSSSDSLKLILKAKHHDPFSFLGLHANEDAFVYRVFLPTASDVWVKTSRTWSKLEKTPC